jgi:hypothetical protein
MTMLRGAVSLAVLTLALAQVPARAQIRYSSGQSVAPIFEGWMKNSDGTFNMVFGYLNRNFDEQVDIPVGAENFCEPAPQDCGQPTHFNPRRQRFLFTVKVAADWPKDRKLLWTIKYRGATESAKAWLVPEYEIDLGVISENGPGGILEAGNTPPKVVKTSAPQTITLPETATVSADVTDDGLPKPRPERNTQAGVVPNQNPNIDPARAAEIAAARTPGIRVRWIVYRGPAGAKVKFDPEQTTPVYGKPVTATTKATFSMPGTYILRAIASDRQLEGSGDVTVTVKGTATR